MQISQERSIPGVFQPFAAFLASHHPSFAGRFVAAGLLEGPGTGPFLRGWCCCWLLMMNKSVVCNLFCRNNPEYTGNIALQRRGRGGETKRIKSQSTATPWQLLIRDIKFGNWSNLLILNPRDDEKNDEKWP